MITERSALGEGLRLLAHFIALTAAFVGLVRVYILATDTTWFLYNSDIVHPFLLVSDVFRDPNAIYTWVHAPSFQLVPDLILAALLSLSGLSPFWQPVFYSALMAAMLCLSVGAVLRAVGVSSAAKGAWAYALAMVLFGAVIVVFDALALSSKLLISTVAIFTHSGALVLTIAALAAFMALLADRRNPWILAGMLFLAVAGTFSDVSFAAWFVAPAFIVALLYGFGRRAMLLLALAALIGVAGIGAYLGESAINMSRSDYLAWRSLSDTWELAKLHAPTILPLFDGVILAVFALTALLTFRCIWIVVRLPKSGKLSRLQAFELFLGGSATAGWLAPLVIGQVTHPNSVRYFQPILACPLIWLLLLAMMRSRFVGNLKWPVLAAPVALAAVMALLSTFNAPAPSIKKHADLIKCLNKEGRTAGLAGYWNGMSIMYLSGRKIHTVSIHPNGTAFKWNINQDWLTGRADNGTAPRFDFVIPEDLTPDVLEQSVGTPQRIVDCEGQPIWLYDEPLEVSMGAGLKR